MRHAGLSKHSEREHERRSYNEQHANVNYCHETQKFELIVRTIAIFVGVGQQIIHTLECICTRIRSEDQAKYVHAETINHLIRAS